MSDPRTTPTALSLIPSTRLRPRRTWLWAGAATVVLLAGVSAGLSGSDEASVDVLGSARSGGRGSGDVVAAADALAGDRGTTTPGTPPRSSVDGERAPEGSGDATTTTTSIEPEDDEVLRPGTPGVITGSGSPGAPAAAAIPAPVELAIVEPFAPAAPPAPTSDTSPVDLLEFPAAGPIDDFVSNEPGCARSCLTTAAVSRSTFTTRLGLQVETDVAAFVRVYVSTDEPTITGGVPSFVGVSPVATSGGHVTSWSGAITGLDADTTYYVIIKATDLAGRSQSVAGPVRTTAQHDQLASPGEGCTFQCITEGVATPTGRFDVVDLHIETSVPARLAVAVSTQEPGWIGGSPILPADIEVSLHDGVREEWNLSASGLAPETTYHVVVRATDLEGRFASRIGSFTTAPEPPATIQVTVEQLMVTYDGDAADVNRGEIELTWAIGDQMFGHRQEEKMHDDTFIEIHSYNSTLVPVARGGLLPNTVLNVTERDADGHSNEGSGCGSGNGVTFDPYYNAACDERTSVAQTGLRTREQVEALPRCAAYGFIEKEDARCALLLSPDLGDEYARFWGIVSYEFR